MGQGVSARPTRTGALAFALILSLGAHFLYLGNIGKWREDFAWTLRDPITGRADWSGLFDFPFFWRPCTLVYVRAINTLFWDFDPARQALAVLAHLFAAWMLLRALRTWGVSRAIANAGTLVFLVLPQSYEVVFWPSATPTSIATALLLILIARVRQVPDRPLSASHLSGFLALAALIPCWNEQPAAGLAALPLLAFAVPSRISSARTRLLRVIVVTAACGAACALYIGLYLWTGPHGSRGALGSYTPPGEIFSKSLDALSDAADLLAGASAYEMVRGSLRIGIPALSFLRGLTWFAACTAAGAAWAWKTRRPAAETPNGAECRTLPVAAFGLAAALAMLLPIVAIRAIRVEPRMLYAPSACLILAVGTGASALTRAASLSRHRWIAATATAALAALLILCGTCLIGYQTLLRRRSAMDWSEVRALKQLVPNPPPESLFLAVRDDTAAAGTRFRAFDRAEFGAWSRDAYGSALLRQVYARKDLYSKRFRRGPEIAVDDDGVTTGVWLRPGYTRGIIETRMFPWSRVFLFAIDADGSVHIAPLTALSASPSPSAVSSPGSPPPPGSPSAAPR